MWLVVTGDIDSEDRNVVEGKWVQLRAGKIDSEDRNVVEGNRAKLQAGVSTVQARTKSAKKLRVAVGEKVINEGRNRGGEENWFRLRARRSGTAAGWSCHQCRQGLCRRLGLAVAVNEVRGGQI